MKKVISYTRPDGGLSICHPVISKDDPKGFTEDMALARALKKDIPPDAKDVTVIGADQVPADREFRNAWKQEAKGVAVDMSIARAIHMGRIREKRNKALAKLDVDWTQAAGKRRDKDADAIEAERQTLRDLPDTFDLDKAATPEELKALWPEGL